MDGRRARQRLGGGGGAMIEPKQHTSASDGIYVIPAKMQIDEFLQWLEDASAEDLEEFGSKGVNLLVNPKMRIRPGFQLPPPNPMDRNSGLR
jgi:hypothetical protein